MVLNRVVLASVAVLALGSPPLAHHSPAVYDMTTEVLVEGTIADVDWRNPHIYLAIETAGTDGRTAVQGIELASIASLQPYGLTRDTLAVGSKVVVRAHPRRQPGGEVLGLDLTTEDGTIYRLHPRGRGVTQGATAPASGLGGQWLPPPASFLGFLAAVNGAALTERALAERADADSLATSQASCTGIFPPPQLMVASYIHTIEVSDAVVVIRVDSVPGERIVHLDGRVLDADAEPAGLGHSVGRWEGETLIIESAGFTPHREGVGARVPSGPGKRMLERLTLTEDRRQIVYDVTVTDPDYLAAPLTYRAVLDHRPDAALTGDCDEETARRFRR
jgi:hypothetical protein